MHRTALMEAACQGYLHIVEALSDRGGADVNVRFEVSRVDDWTRSNSEGCDDSVTVHVWLSGQPKRFVSYQRACIFCCAIEHSLLSDVCSGRGPRANRAQSDWTRCQYRDDERGQLLMMDD